MTGVEVGVFVIKTVLVGVFVIVEVDVGDGLFVGDLVGV